MGVLAGHAVGGQLHQDGLGSHCGLMCQHGTGKTRGTWHRTEGKLLVNARPDDVRVDDETVGDVIHGQKDRVGQQELEYISTNLPKHGMPTYHLGNIHATDGACAGQQRTWPWVARGHGKKGVFVFAGKG